MPGKQIQRGDTARAYSLGFELVCAVAGFVLVGIWIDRHYSSGPWGTLICLCLGLIGGFYNLIRGAARMSAGLVPGAPGTQPDSEAGSGTDGAPSPGSRSGRAARTGGDDRRP
jgi:F0F1-type ATP synthase assembly protein I